VFISYARKDAAQLAQRLQRDLSKQGFDAWLDTQRLAGGATWSSEIERAIDASRVVLALMTPGSYVSEICRAEQLRSLRKGKRVIPLLGQPDADRPLHLEAKQYLNFTSASAYRQGFEELLAAIRGDARGARGAHRVQAALAEKYRVTHVTYVTAPPAVANYIERPEALRALRDALFSDRSISGRRRQPIGLTALAGMGGIGKTVLAQALTRDEVVQQAFPDGIVWITIGRESKYDLVTIFAKLGKALGALGDDLQGYDTEPACINQYKTSLAQKAVLIVVDDVWKKSDLDPFLAESPCSRLLFTTRDASIARFAAAQQHTAEPLDLEESRALLAAWAGLNSEVLPPEADAIIEECGSLPLALAMIGPLLQDAGRPGGEVWSDTVELLQKADLAAIASQLPPGQDSFFRAVEVSFQALAPEMQERYQALAVLLEDMAAPLPVLETLWAVNDAEARRISRHFVDRSLAQWGGVPAGAEHEGKEHKPAEQGAAEQGTKTGSIRLHDLQLDYVRAQYPDRRAPDPVALNLIHGAVRLSSHVIERDPEQFASQMVGRLLPYVQPKDPAPPIPAVQQFTSRLVEGAPRPWLRPLWPVLHPAGTALLRTLVGHSGWATGVSVSPDGRQALSASEDGTLKLWDLETGRELRTLAGHSVWVTGVAMSADGRRAVSASVDQTLKVWNLATGRGLHTLAGHSDRVNGVALSGDGRRAVSASQDHTLKVWDVETGRQLVTLTGHSDAVNSVAISRDGRRAVSASEDKTLKVWNLNTGRELHTLTGHAGAVSGVGVTPDGHRGVSASSDRTLKLWDLEAGRELRTLAGHDGAFHCVAVSPDGRWAVCGAGDQALKVWDLETGQEVRTLVGHSGWVIGVAVSADRRRAVSASSDRTLKVWDLETSRELSTLAGHVDAVHGVAVSGDGRRAVSASEDGTLKVWDLETGRILRTFSGPPSAARGVAVSADGRLAVSISAMCLLSVWDLKTGRELNAMGYESAANCVAVSADGKRAVSASAAHALKVWELKTGRELRTLAGHSGAVKAVAMSADGSRAVSAADDKTLKVWDLETGRKLRTLTGHSDAVCGVAVSPDGMRAVSASDDRTLKVWDLETGSVVAAFTCDAPARCCAFAGDHRIVAGDQSGRVHFLSLEPKEDI
jgi:WD40 repeat protein